MQNSKKLQIQSKTNRNECGRREYALPESKLMTMSQSSIGRMLEAATHVSDL